MGKKPDNDKVIGVDFLSQQKRKSKIRCPKCKTGNEFSAEMVGLFILEYSERGKKHFLTASADALEIQSIICRTCMERVDDVEEFSEKLYRDFHDTCFIDGEREVEFHDPNSDE